MIKQIEIEIEYDKRKILIKSESDNINIIEYKRDIIEKNIIIPKDMINVFIDSLLYIGKPENRWQISLDDKIFVRRGTNNSIHIIKSEEDGEMISKRSITISIDTIDFLVSAIRYVV